MIEHDPNFLDQLRRHEGLRLTPYRCTGGALTIGYGHNLDAHPLRGYDGVSPISEETAEALLLADAEQVAAELDRVFSWWADMNHARQAVLLNMAFNLGLPRLKGFKKALAAMRARDWNTAGKEMLASKWARDVKGRAAELASQMVLGTWQEG